MQGHYCERKRSGEKKNNSRRTFKTWPGKLTWGDKGSRLARGGQIRQKEPRRICGKNYN